MSNAYAPLSCPLHGCGQDLYVRFDHAVSLYAGTLAGREPVAPTDADVSTWKVECVVGHVVLVPGPSGCTLDHGGHDCGCDVDHGEEVRTFRASDLDRLRVLIAQLSGGAPQPELFYPDDDCSDDESIGGDPRSGCAITPTCTLRCYIRHQAGEAQPNDALMDTGSHPTGGAR